MSFRHPLPWTIELRDNGERETRSLRRAKRRVEWANIIDARGVYVAEGLDPETARHIVYAVNGDLAHIGAK